MDTLKKTCTYYEFLLPDSVYILVMLSGYEDKTIDASKVDSDHDEEQKQKDELNAFVKKGTAIEACGFVMATEDNRKLMINKLTKCVCGALAYI